ncbi:MAG TPA: alpha/beta fold hydrolase [Steroidobacteraceae bacterium]|nr:alpha/beta fold hydrolase [Steroidobacteraceae bacterium]
MVKLVDWSLLGLVVCASILLGIFLINRGRRKRQSADVLAVRTANGIDEGLFVRAGGIEQWISIRGEDRNNPVLLVLHGGPATSYMAFTQFFLSWERHFTVVQWDRRGVGKTFGRNGSSGSGEMTLDRIADDGADIAAFLCRHLHRDRIFLLGHSMGSMIGITLAARRPDLVDAYVGTEQIIDMASNEDLSYRIILERARACAAVQTVRKLERIGPPPYRNPRHWGVKQSAAEVVDSAYGRIAGHGLRTMLYSPSYSFKDIFDFVGGSRFSIDKLYSQWQAFDARQLGSSFKTPIFIIEGESDVMTPPELADAWLAGIDAPQKAFVPIKGGSHMVFVTAADAYLAELLARVRPLAAIRA